MKTLDIDVQAAPNKWWAMQDRRNQNIANATLYTLPQRTRAIRLQVALQAVYHGRFFDSPNYGKRGISVKIEEPIISDRKTLRALEAFWDTEGIIKKRTPQGICYYIKKA